MKEIKLKHAEVVTFYNSEEVLREKKCSNGSTMFMWRVKTKINDRAEKSPIVWDSCTMFVENEQAASSIRDNIVLGKTLEITGTIDRVKGKEVEGQEPKWYDNVRVTDVLPYTNEAASGSDDGLPF